MRATVLGRQAALCCCVLLFGCLAAYAQASPPLITDDTGTPGPNRWEINIGATNEEVMAAHIYEAPILDMNYGIGRYVELTYEVPWTVRSTGSVTLEAGIGDSVLACKWRFRDQHKHGLSISTYPQFAFNTRQASVYRGLVEPGKQLYLPLEMGHDFGFLELNGEAGYNIEFAGADEWAGGLSAAVPAGRRLTLLGEVHATTSTSFGVARSVADGGGTLKLSKVVTVLLMAGHRLRGGDQNVPRVFGYLGLQFHF